MTRLSRDEVVHVARDMFRDRGYDGFSMGDLADRVGIKKASLYSRFSGKDELAQEALALTSRELAAFRDDRGDWLTSYRRLLERVALYLGSSKRCIGLHFVYGAQSEAVREATRQFFEGLVAQFTTVLSDGLTAEGARSLAEDSVASLEGATLWLSINNDDAPIFRMIESLVLTAAAIAERDGSALEVLSRYGTAERSGSVAEMKLATEVAQLEELLGLRNASSSKQ